MPITAPFLYYPLYFIQFESWKVHIKHTR